MANHFTIIVIFYLFFHRGGYYEPGQGNGTCEDKWPEDKCIKLMEADKCEKMAGKIKAF